MTTPTDKLKPCPEKHQKMFKRFWDKVMKSKECWVWIGSKNKRGYGKLLHANGKLILAHRLSYIIHKGPISEGMTVDHLCNNPSCVNPKHLDQKSQRRNNMRSNSPTAVNARKTHCIHGHPLSGRNVRFYENKGVWRRACLTCDRIRKSQARKEQA